MSINLKVKKRWAIYSLGLGVAYACFGLLGILAGLSQTYGLILIPLEVGTALIYPDIFGGAMLMVIGVIFLFGVRPQWRGAGEGASFLVVGTFLSGVLFAVDIALMLSHAIGVAAFNIAPEPYAEIMADWAEWTCMNDLLPGIWLFAFVIPGLQLALRLWKAR